MTTDLVQHQPATLAERKDYAVALSGSDLLPRQYRGQPANLLFALEYADALGVAPVHALTSIHVIEGKPSASADLIGSLIRRAGHRLRITGDDTYAEAVLIRADDPDHEFRVRWDLDRAKRAGLTGKKGPWQSYPAAMLRSRAITEVGRMGAPDALFGVIYTPEELGAEVDAEGAVVEATVMPRSAARPTTRSGGAALAAAVAPVATQQHDAPQAGRVDAPPEHTGPVPRPEPEVLDGEVVDEPADTLDVPTPATPAQRQAVVKAAGAAGAANAEQALLLVSGVVGREVTSTSELTADEAEAVVIDLGARDAA